MTKVGCEAGVVFVVMATGVLVAGVSVTVEEGTEFEAMVSNDAVVVAAVLVFELVVSTSMGRTEGSRALNSGCGGRFFNASRRH
uniref:Secreted protein n=1 Tax=Romanomermis culicivorax TaxID=13658 RepID=A0A915KMA5_ROMCU